MATVQLHMSPRREPDPLERPMAAPLSETEEILGAEDASLLDIVDNVLSKGVVLSGDINIGLANVDLIYARLSLLLCAADRIMPGEDEDVLVRHSRRNAIRRRERARRAAQADKA